MADPALPELMGVLNVTPDSFSDGGAYFSADAAVAHGRQLIAEGAAIIDIGGESTQPGAEDVPVTDELARVLPVIAGFAGVSGAVLSIDTRKPEVARRAVAAGAAIWNDVSALRYAPESMAVAAELDCGLVLMHAQGTPATMQIAPHYDDVVGEVYAFFEARLAACAAAGINRERMILDPGIGFGKTLEHNLALLRQLSRFADFGRPLLIGVSRKSFLGAVSGGAPPAARLGGSLAAALHAWRQGASILRVHDVAATRQALVVAAALG